MILGAVLAGGASRRFGSDKALAEWRGAPLIDHVLAAMAPFVAARVVCGRDWPGYPAVPDRPAPGLGPLAGLAGALAHAAAHGFDRVLTLPCDTPRLGPALLATLVAAEAPALLRGCPVIGIWRTTQAPALDAHLAGADRSMRAWAHAAGATWLDAEAPANVNHAADLARLGTAIPRGGAG